MKISLKTNTYIITTAFIYSALLTTFVIFKINHIKLYGYSNYLFNTIFEATYLILIAYLINLLKYLKEKRSVIIVFTIFIVYDILVFLYSLFVKPSGNSIQTGLIVGLGSLIISILIFTYTFIIKTKQFRLPFRFFGGAFIFILLFKMVGAVLMISHYYMAVRPYMALVELLTPLAILNILFKAHHYLKKELVLKFMEH